MDEIRVPLYRRLPEIYRIRDQEQQPAQQLEHYLAPVEQVFDAIHRDIEGLYDNLFIDTCADWVIPYLGDLVGATPLSGDPDKVRRDVADTIGLRRRKGTLHALELLTRNLTGWGVHCRELMENVTWAQHLNHLRPDAGSDAPFAWSQNLVLAGLDDFRAHKGCWVWIIADPPVVGKSFLLGSIKSVVGNTVFLVQGWQVYAVPFDAIREARLAAWDRNTPIRGGTVPVRDPALLSLLDSPFDPFAHTPDLKPPTFGNVRYNLPNLAVFLWRLEAYRIPLSPPAPRRPDCISEIVAAAAPQARYMVGFHVHPLGMPIPLFNADRNRPDEMEPRTTTVDEAPGPIPLARLTQGSPGGNPGAYVSCDSYDETQAYPGTLDISNPGLQFHLPAGFFSEEEWSFRGANLCAWEQGVHPPVLDREIVIDPRIGRVLLGVRTRQEAEALQAHLLVTYTYGAVGRVGAHPVSRPALPRLGGDGPVKEIKVEHKDSATELSQALNALVGYEGVTTVTITDSQVYHFDIDDLPADLKATDAQGQTSLRLSKSLVIRAAEGERPILRLARPLCFCPRQVTSADAREQARLKAEIAGLTVRLEGLYLTRDADWDAEHGVDATATPLIGRAALHRLEVIGCTLDPGGWLRADGETRSPVYAAMRLREPYGFTASVDEDVFDQTPEVFVQESITGPLLLDVGYKLQLKDSITDAGVGMDEDAQNALAISGATDARAGWGPDTSVSGVTVWGRVRVDRLCGRGAIWVHRLEVQSNQERCLKFSRFSGDHDRLMPHFACVRGPEARLRFTSEAFGQPGYGQLLHTTDERIRQRGPQGDQMGAYGFLNQEHMWRNLCIRFREFMPVGIRPLLIPVT